LIDHITIRVTDLARSKDFYEKAFHPLGYAVAFGDQHIFWAFDVGNGCLFEIAQSKERPPVTPVHIAFRVGTSALVKEFYGAALAAGARDNGAPGPRPQYTKNYFAAFVLDPDGHNIEAVFDT
jgi:catechol 2,3-dioxygenase-like lactoylglutathione lyase family enzyme